MKIVDQVDLVAAAQLERARRRVREQELLDASEDRKRGHEAGRRWALEHGTERAFQRLHNDVKHANLDGWGFFERQFVGPNLWADELYFAMYPTGNGGERVRDFWTLAGVAESDWENTDLMEGWVEGALEVWYAMN